ncbi:MAG TPA: D-alanine--D-alanine ligase [Candidatus Eisenbacteria bacterium]
MRIAVLMGGTSSERQVSLASGRGVVAGLKGAGHEVTAIDAADGHVFSDAELAALKISVEPPRPQKGSRRALATCAPLLNAELAFIIVHGGEGEDGTLQAFLEMMDIPYTGSGMRACALTWDKEIARRMMAADSIPVAAGFLAPLGMTPAEVRARIDAEVGWPAIVKPNAQGSTIGVTRLDTADGLAAALEKAAVNGGDALIERFIPGHELTVTVFDGEVFPVTEIVADTGFYDYERKYQKGHTRYVTPAEISAERAAEAQRLTGRIFQLFGCRGVARVDFRMTPEGDLYCLEINTVPGMTEMSLVPMGARALGIDYPELVDRMARAALAAR